MTLKGNISVTELIYLANYLTINNTLKLLEIATKDLLYVKDLYDDNYEGTKGLSDDGPVDNSSILSSLNNSRGGLFIHNRSMSQSSQTFFFANSGNLGGAPNIYTNVNYKFSIEALKPLSLLAHNSSITSK